MGQTFHLISIDRKEYNDIGKLVEAMGNVAPDLPYTFAKPTIQLQPTKFYHRSAYSQDTLSNLPAELLLLIFKHVDLASTLSLSLASKRLWEIGWPYLRDCIIRSLTSWRGTRLICEGEYNIPCDMPPDILSSDELHSLEDGLHEDGLELLRGVTGEEYDEELIDGPICLTYLVLARGKYIRTGLESHNDLDIRFLLNSHGLSKPQRDEVYNFICDHQQHKLFSQSQDWTLRNISSKKFVQGTKLNAAFHPDQPSTGLILPHPGFGAAIISQTMWTTFGDTCFGLNRGDWAGHRFEIIPHEEHLASADPSWKDESDKVIKDLVQMGIEV